MPGLTTPVEEHRCCVVNQTRKRPGKTEPSLRCSLFGGNNHFRFGPAFMEGDLQSNANTNVNTLFSTRSLHTPKFVLRLLQAYRRVYRSASNDRSITMHLDRVCVLDWIDALGPSGL